MNEPREAPKPWLVVLMSGISCFAIVATLAVLVGVRRGDSRGLASFRERAAEVERELSVLRTVRAGGEPQRVAPYLPPLESEVLALEDIARRPNAPAGFAEKAATLRRRLEALRAATAAQ